MKICGYNAVNKVYNTHNDRRVCRRINKYLRVRFKVRGDDIFREAETVDISGGGIKMRFDDPIKPADHLLALIYPMDKKDPVELECVCVWCKQLWKDRFHAGFKLMVLKNDISFIKFITEVMIEDSLRFAVKNILKRAKIT